MKTCESLNVVKTNAWYCEKQTQNNNKMKDKSWNEVSKTREMKEKTNKLGLGTHCFVQCKSVK